MDKITGIILSGGKSRRVGRDKAFLPFPGRALIEIMIDKMSGLFDQLLIVTNKPEPYLRYGIKTVADIVPECGPLGGIYTGLLSSESEYNFIVACDMPFINQDLIRYMLKKSKGYAVTIADYRGRLEPLCAVYSKNCIKPIENELSKKSLKITDFFQYVNSAPRHPALYSNTLTGTSTLKGTGGHKKYTSRGGVKVRIISEREIAGFDSKGISFLNINTPDDYQRLLVGSL